MASISAIDLRSLEPEFTRSGTRWPLTIGCPVCSGMPAEITYRARNSNCFESLSGLLRSGAYKEVSEKNTNRIASTLA